MHHDGILLTPRRVVFTENLDQEEQRYSCFTQNKLQELHHHIHLRCPWCYAGRADVRCPTSGS